MDAQAGVGRDPSAQLREQIHHTQIELGEKLGALEGEVRGVTAHAKEAIQDRISAVRDAVDVRQYVARHPLLWGALAVGSGVWVARRARQRRVVTDAPRAGWVRGAVAPQLAALQAMIVGRAFSFIIDRARDRLLGANLGSSPRDRAK
jgi:hypothetical protein